MNQGMALHPGTIVIIILATLMLIVFWKALIKLVLAVMAAGIILTIAYTAIVIYQKAHGTV